jgi:tetraacyldisaccharide 4'-kinase
VKLLRKILFPVVPIYHSVTWLRNLCYDSGVFKSKSYDFPIICVGNLSVGGTGKTPMIEYLIELLKDDYKVATLSRGYKRDTDGFQLANITSSALTIGDEPFQFYQKFDDIIVSVDADRQHGIAELKSIENQPEVILLDDAFQHRKVKAGFNVLLTTYEKPYSNDYALPTGDLREPKSGANRADVIVVTKCPNNLSVETMAIVANKLKPLPNQRVFFSSIVYSKTIYSLDINKPILDIKDDKFTLVTGIANPKPLLNYLNNEGYNFEHLNFKDHHNFTKVEIELLNSKSLVLTTEKDFTRLKDRVDTRILYYLPIAVQMSNADKFNSIIKRFVSSY